MGQGIFESRDGGVTWRVGWRVPPDRMRFVEAAYDRILADYYGRKQALDIGPYTMVAWDGIVVANAGHEGVVVRSRTGEWVRSAVGLASPTPFGSVWLMFRVVRNEALVVFAGAILGLILCVWSGLGMKALLWGLWRFLLVIGVVGIIGIILWFVPMGQFVVLYAFMFTMMGFPIYTKLIGPAALVLVIPGTLLYWLVLTGRHDRATVKDDAWLIGYVTAMTSALLGATPLTIWAGNWLVIYPIALVLSWVGMAGPVMISLWLMGREIQSKAKVPAASSG